ncbi:hypothetical protein V2G26_014477 [Clonostachys chloroleuca]
MPLLGWRDAQIFGAAPTRSLPPHSHNPHTHSLTLLVIIIVFHPFVNLKRGNVGFSDMYFSRMDGFLLLFVKQKKNKGRTLFMYPRKGNGTEFIIENERYR